MACHAIVVGPNGGCDLVYGGGTYTALQMANTLAKAGYITELIAAYSLPREKLEDIHGIKLHPNVKLSYLFNWYNRVPYTFPIIYPLFSKYLQKRVNSLKPDIVIFNDDAPKNVLYHLKRNGFPTAIYLHFSSKVRSLMPLLAIKWQLQNHLEMLSYLNFARQMFADIDMFDIVIANSTVTKKLTQAVYSINIDIIYPPVPIKNIGIDHKTKPSDKLIAIHVSQQDRSFLLDFLINILKNINFSSISNTLKFYLLNCNTQCYRQLKRFSNNVLALRFLKKELYTLLLKRSHVVTHFKWFESFGIAVVEAMSEGAVPLVYKSDLNAVWIDVLEKGRWGYGFKNSDEFIDTLITLAQDFSYLKKKSNESIMRARCFSIDVFEKNILDKVI